MKTPPILLKILQNSAAKLSPNFNKTASRKGDRGFTLLELIVIVLILGLLSAIAAPSWLAFINRQRVRTVNDRVLQTLRSAQSEAKRTKSDRTVTFNPTDPPTVTINTVPALTDPLQTVTFDAGGEIKKGQVKISAASCTAGACAATATLLTFNFNGVVDINSPPLPFVVTVSTVDGGSKQCVIVETLLGGMRTDEGEFNTGTGQGCPVSP